jgi:hypothetical protein
MNRVVLVPWSSLASERVHIPSSCPSSPDYVGEEGAVSLFSSAVRNPIQGPPFKWGYHSGPAFLASHSHRRLTGIFCGRWNGGLHRVDKKSSQLKFWCMYVHVFQKLCIIIQLNSCHPKSCIRCAGVHKRKMTCLHNHQTAIHWIASGTPSPRRCIVVVGVRNSLNVSAKDRISQCWEDISQAEIRKSLMEKDEAEQCAVKSGNRSFLRDSRCDCKTLQPGIAFLFLAPQG